MQSLELPSFFFTNSTSAPHSDALGRINLFSSRSSICFFNSTNSIGAILYDAINTRPAPGMKSILKFTSLLSGSSGISFRNTSTYSSTIGMLFDLFSCTLLFSLNQYHKASSSSFYLLHHLVRRYHLQSLCIWEHYYVPSIIDDNVVVRQPVHP